jgi:hypothetical protein
VTFTLITNAYDEKDLHRSAEYQVCLARNLELSHFERVVVVYESGGVYVPLEHPKLAVEHLGKRGTFAEYFAIANRLASGSKVVLANADIYFDDTLGLLEPHKLKGLICLSRWDTLPDGTSMMMPIPDSHDAWIFCTPFNLPKCDFTLGVPGCDGRIAWIASEVRLPLSNPARSVRANHLHQSGVRHYTELHRLRGQYQAVWATELPVISH